MCLISQNNFILKVEWDKILTWFLVPNEWTLLCTVHKDFIMFILDPNDSLENKKVQIKKNIILLGSNDWIFGNQTKH